MLRHLGYAGISLSTEASASRTTRLANATPARLRELIATNLAGLRAILETNLAHHIYLFRISSVVIPFASHPANPLPWWDEFAPQLDSLGQFIRQHGMRVSMHPGRYTTLSAVDPDVLRRAILDLEWHVRFLDALGLDAQHKIILHLGGTYGDKPAAITRFIQAARSLPPAWPRRLVLENDERSYTVHDALQVSREIGWPVVLDVLHHSVNPGPNPDLRANLAACFATWRPADGIPKTHYSDQASTKRQGSHSDWVDPDRFVDFLHQTPPVDFDCMLEAKKKDLALIRLRSALAALGLTIDPAA